MNVNMQTNEESCYRDLADTSSNSSDSARVQSQGVENALYASTTIGDGFDQIEQGVPVNVHHLNVQGLKKGQQADASYNSRMEPGKRILTENGKAITSAMNSQIGANMKVTAQKVEQ